MWKNICNAICTHSTRLPKVKDQNPTESHTNYSSHDHAIKMKNCSTMRNASINSTFVDYGKFRNTTMADVIGQLVSWRIRGYSTFWRVTNERLSIYRKCLYMENFRELQFSTLTCAFRNERIEIKAWSRSRTVKMLGEMWRLHESS